MNDYDSDSSQGSASGTATTVLLGYASREPTGDEVSHLGGQPTWLDPSSPPSASLASCKSCSALMPLLLQLNGALPERFPGHERRLYIWGCPRKRCRRKEGSVRAVRGVRVAGGRDAAVEEGAKGEEKKEVKEEVKEKVDIGGQLFGGGAGGGIFGASASSSSANPFSKGAPSSSSNPFSTTQPQTTPDTTSLSETFASKARISTPAPTPPQPTSPPTPWPSDPSALPSPYPHLHLDAEYEYLAPSSPPKPTSAHYAALMDTSASTSSDGKDMYESAHDRAFQAFADRLAENPEQVLRYEFAGTPLLSSRSDGVGNVLSGGGADKGGTLARVPRCARCGAGRVFEVQLTPQAIAEMEGDAVDEGVEWCTVVVGVCERDCGGGNGAVEYCEEWCGVQWEEQVARAR